MPALCSERVPEGIAPTESLRNPTRDPPLPLRELAAGYLDPQTEAVVQGLQENRGIHRER